MTNKSGKRARDRENAKRSHSELSPPRVIMAPIGGTGGHGARDGSSNGDVGLLRELGGGGTSAPLLTSGTSQPPARLRD